jgi:hypothetical protein
VSFGLFLAEAVCIVDVNDVDVWFRPVAAHRSVEGGLPGIEIRHKRTGEVLVCLNPVVLFDQAALDEAIRDGKKLGELTLADGIEGANLQGVNLSEADLGWQLLLRANLEGASLEAAELAGTSFRNANLRCANLRGAWCHMADFQGADLTDVDLAGATLKRACLEGAILTGANLAGVDLTGARYDTETRWPVGFDPERHGAMGSES